MVSVRQNVQLAPYTTLDIGGPAKYFCEVETLADVKEAYLFAQEHDVPIVVLGGGSNVLIGDAGVSGLVIKNNLKGIEYSTRDDGTVECTVGSGEWLDTVIETTCRLGYQGLENLSGIPGTAGGAVVQNANAYGATIGDVVSSVDVFDLESGIELQLTAEECNFSYRHSVFKKSDGLVNMLVTKVTFTLPQDKTPQLQYQSASQSIKNRLTERGVDSPTPRDVRQVVLEIRKNIGMLEGQFKSAGSFFVNPVLSVEAFIQLKSLVMKQFQEKEKMFRPWYWQLPHGSVKVSAAFLLECTPFNKTDFNSMSELGSVGISPLHSLSVINLGQAHAVDVELFVNKIKDTVLQKFNVALESEVCFLFTNDEKTN